MSIGYEDLRDASYRALGINRETVAQTKLDPIVVLPRPPNALTDGASMALSDGNYPEVAALKVMCRQYAGYQQAWYYGFVVGVGDTYRVTINAVVYDYIALLGDTVSDVIDGLIAVLNIGGIAGLNITYTPPSTLVAGSALLVYDTTDSTNKVWTGVVLATGTGTGTMTGLDQEATTVTFEVYIAWQGELGYDLVRGMGALAIAPDAAAITKNWTENLEIGGARYMFCRILATDGVVQPRWKPGGLPA